MVSLFWTLTALMITGWVWTLGGLVTPNTFQLVFILDMLFIPVMILIPLIGGGYFARLSR